MRDRVTMAGGTFEAGASDGTWTVRAELPEPTRVTVRVALVDDQAMFRAGIAMVVDSQPDLEVVGQAEDGDQVPGLVAQSRPDVVVMDVRMSRVDGVTATRLLHDRLGEAAPRVLVLTTFDLDEAAVSAIEAGASGFVLKDARPELLLAAIRAVADGSQVVAAGATRSMLERFRAARSGPGPEYDRAHAPRAGDPAARGRRAVERRDRRRRAPLRGDGEDPRLPDPGQARAARPGAARRLRLRARAALTRRTSCDVGKTPLAADVSDPARS